MQERYFNRELSWLAFNERVLAQSLSEKTPLLTRMRFLSIFTGNLDAFCMVRVGSLNDRFLLGDNLDDNKTHLRPSEQLSLILRRMRKLYKQRDACFSAVVAALKGAGLTRLTMSALSGKQKSAAEAYFRERILPVLSPHIVDSKHPFPFLENRVKYLMVRLADNKSKKTFGVARLGDAAGKALFFEEAPGRFLLCEDLMLYYAPVVFKSYAIEHAVILRATRNADYEAHEGVVDSEEDYRKQLRSLLKKRERLAPVRLELYKKQDDRTAAFLLRHTAIDKSQMFFSRAPLDYDFLSCLEESLTPERRAALLQAPVKPRWPEGLVRGQSIIDQVRQKDILLMHPRDSMEPLVELLREAGLNENTVSVQISLYRLSADSQIVAGLCRAAESGKQVTVTLELKARFDERNNIGWSSALEEAGCHVIYGLQGYKAHAKALLITLRHEGGVSHITHVSTGNYNERTARQYTDVGLLTANADLGRDVKEYFDNLALSRVGGRYRHLLVAPASLRPGLLRLIGRETERAGRGLEAQILLKMNGLTDKALIDSLYEAAQAGVRVRLIVRGICCLRPGVPGLSDNLEVVSLVGRFLEHARIFCFGAGDSREVYLSSADGMTRNMERRVEIALPIFDRELAGRLYDLLCRQLADTVDGRRLLADGRYVPLDAAAERPASAPPKRTNPRAAAVNRPAPAPRPAPAAQEDFVWQTP